MLPVAGESRLVIVDLVKSLETLSTNTILLLVKEVVKRPNQIKGEQVHHKHTMLTLPPRTRFFIF